MQKKENEVSSLYRFFSPIFARDLKPYIFGSGPALAELKTVYGNRFDFSFDDISILESDVEDADILVICGPVTYKILPSLLEAKKRLVEPNWVLWLGGESASSSELSSYSIVDDLSKYISVDVFVPGSPPTPEQIIDGFLQIRDIIQNGK